MAEGIAILVPVVLAFVSFLALVIGLRRRERAGVRRAMTLAVVCAGIALSSWLTASALHARGDRQMYTGKQRMLLAGQGIHLGAPFDRASLVGGAPYAWFPAVAAALLALRIRFLTSPAKPQ